MAFDAREFVPKPRPPPESPAPSPPPAPLASSVMAWHAGDRPAVVEGFGLQVE